MEWKEVERTNGKYLVSDTGAVFSVASNKTLKPINRGNGYYYVEITFENGVKKEFIHRLVAQAFLPNPHNYPIINHKDENPANNRVENLEWCDYKYNTNYGTCIDRMTENREYHSGKDNPKSKRVYMFDFDGNLVREFESCNIAANELGLSRKSISKAASGNLKQYNGYVWSYENKFPEITGKRLYSYEDIPIVQIDLQGNIVKEYANANDTKEYGFLPQSVRQCCNGKLKTTGGYIWKYKKDI